MEVGAEPTPLFVEGVDSSPISHLIDLISAKWFKNTHKQSVLSMRTEAHCVKGRRRKNHRVEKAITRR